MLAAPSACLTKSAVRRTVQIDNSTPDEEWRRAMKRLVQVLVVVVSLVVLSVPVVVAQDSTSIALMGNVVDPAECTVEPAATDKPEAVLLHFSKQGNAWFVDSVIEFAQAD
jgi:hypothetical protein